MFSRNRSKHLRRAAVFVSGMFAISAMVQSTASAQSWNKKTMVTFNVPVEVPGAGAQVLPPGNYVFKLVDSQSDRNIVQILSQDELHVYATILAIPNLRLKATDKTVMTFAERAAGQPQAIRAWFYPGERWGQEFVYPKSKAVELAKIANLPVPYIPDEVAATIGAAPVTPAAAAPAPAVFALRAVPVLAVQPTGEVVQIAEVFEAPPAQTAQTPSVLPKTAGNSPLLAFMGLLLAALGIVPLKKLCAR